MIRAIAIAAGLLALVPGAWAQGAHRSNARVEVEYAWEYNYPGRSAGNILRPVDAIPWPNDWDLSPDYPPAALAAGISGVVVVIVSIAADDRITNCAPIETADDARLTDSVCPLVLRRGRFRHALSATGKPLPGLVGLRFRFVARPVPAPPMIAVQALSPKPLDPAALVIEDAPVAIFPERRVSVELDIDAAGVVTHCELSGSTGTDEGDIQLCRRATAIRFEPWRPNGGEARPVKSGFVTFEFRP